MTLRLRICPNCQEETYSLKSYFCHRCGAELPPPSGLSSAKGGSGSPKFRGEGKKRFLVLRLAVVGGVFMLIGAVGIGFYDVYSQSRSSPASLTSIPEAPANEIFTAKVLFPIENHPFSARGLSEVVPAEIDWYLESNQPEKILPAILPAADWEKIEAVLLEAVGLTSTETASFLEEEFAIFQEASSSAFLARVKDSDFLQSKIAPREPIDGWQVRLLQSYVVVYDSEEILVAIENAMKKLTLNLSLVADFVEARRKLPSSGQVFSYGSERWEFIPESLKGNAFVVSGKGGGTLVTGR